jgi:dTDP-4-amino-4,6-dideoxygalactose transaminase
LARLRAERANPAFDVWFGGSGDMGCFSFQGSKNLPAGEGGIF